MALQIIQQADLLRLNTFAISESADNLVAIESEQELRQALALAHEKNWPVTLLGGGSNLVLGGPLPGLTIAMRNRGRRIVSRAGGSVIVEGAAGEGWHAFVCWSLDLGLSGLENLSLIPGTLGAAPMQNIGAYGVELNDVFDSLDALDRNTGELRRFDGTDCAFAYRDSLFKQHPGRFIILRVRLRLGTEPAPRLDYAPLAAAWRETGLTRADSRVISHLVCAIRRSKLPDPAILGNVGSFFKNPLVSARQACAFLHSWPGMPQYPQADGKIKLAAGWLIEQAGWKGVREGNVGVHRDQALVLVNFGGARGAEVMRLANKVQADVFARFGVELEMEPRLVGS